ALVGAAREDEDLVRRAHEEQVLQRVDEEADHHDRGDGDGEDDGSDHGDTAFATAAPPRSFWTSRPTAAPSSRTTRITAAGYIAATAANASSSEPATTCKFPISARATRVAAATTSWRSCWSA